MIKLVLPYPPSTNRYWRLDRRNGHLHLSPDAEKFRADVKLIAGAVMGNQLALRGPLSVAIRLYRPQASGDVDNFIKQPLDALQGVVYDNDSQIIRLTADRFDDRANPRCEVDVAQIGPVDQPLFERTAWSEALIASKAKRSRRRA